MRPTRRSFLSSAAAGAIAAGTSGKTNWLLAQAAAAGIPVRAITKGPGFHWFGYYDKLQFDPTGRYVLGNHVMFEGRKPKPDDTIQVGMIDTEDNDRWIHLGESKAWSWQQGCMLQWIPGTTSQVIWNDREGDHFVSHVLDVNTGKRRTLPAPIYSLSPNGKWAIYTDFSRLEKSRPGYGYAGVPDPNEAVSIPKNSGVWRLDLVSGEHRLLLSIADADAVNDGISKRGTAKQRLEHLLISPDGSRFCFLHRWDVRENSDAFVTRLVTAKADGTDMYSLDPYGKTSHFIWRDPEHILAWSWHPSGGDGFYVYKDRTRDVEQIGAGIMPENGHCTYLSGNQWILNDTYPDKQRLQHPFLYQIKTGKRFPLGDFRTPPEYTGEFRCDTHPRSSRNGLKVTIDSPHGGNGRQIYLLDVSSIVAGTK